MSALLSDGAVSVDGVITAPAGARIPAMDHGLLFGDSVYDVVRTWEGRPAAWPEHFDRLRQSAAAIYMQLPWSRDELGARIQETIAATGLDECYVRIVVTRGSGPMSLLPDACAGPSLILYVLPLRLYPEEWTRDGIDVVVPGRLRNDVRALSPGAKTGNYLNNLLALVEARDAGVQDAVLLNAHGHVTEATTANVFWVRDEVLFTPELACGLLPGITRASLLDALRRHGLDVRSGPYPLGDLTGADEAFLTSTIRGVMGIARIDGQPVGAGRPGPVTRRVAEINREVMEQSAGPW